MDTENNDANLSAEDEFAQTFDQITDDGAKLEAAETNIEAATEAESEATIEAATEAQSETATEAETNIEAEAEPDLWADAPDELRTQYQAVRDQNAKLEQANKSHAGRLGAMQRQLNQFQSTPADKKPSAAVVADAMETPESWAKFHDEYPEIHAAVESRIEQVTSQNKNQTQELINAAIQPLQAAEQDRINAHEMAALEAAHNDWENVVASEEFNNWISGQPPQMHTMLDGDTAHEVSAVLSAFKGTRPAPQTSNITDRKAQRQEQLEKSAGIKSRPGPGATGVIPNDFDGAWDAITSG